MRSGGVSWEDRVTSGAAAHGPVELPGYEFVRELGRGPAGTVYLARQLERSRDVAVKRIVGGATSQDPESLLRFQREARLLLGLDHPNLVRVHDLVRANGDLFVVMEYVPGDDLRQLMASGPPAPEPAVAIVSDLAAALDRVHQHGVVHRDVKPANVLIAGDGTPKLGDIGLTRLLESQARFTTGRRTPAYMAPELARGDTAIDRRADVYSLGVIAYELLVGRLPFPVDPTDEYATVRAHVEQPAPRPGQLLPGFPPLLEAALLWALHKHPERRPATAGEFARALQDALRRSPGAVPALDRAALPANGAAVEAAGAANRARGIRGLAWLPPALVGAACALAAAGAVAWAAGELRAPSSPPPEGAFRVDAVTVTADPPGGSSHCPAATVTVRARIVTDGAGGRVAYVWLLPDGRPADAGRATVRSGTRQTDVSTTLRYEGSAASAGIAVLHVTTPADVYSAPVTIAYTCP